MITVILSQDNGGPRIQVLHINRFYWVDRDKAQPRGTDDRGRQKYRVHISDLNPA